MFKTALLLLALQLPLPAIAQQANQRLQYFPPEFSNSFIKCKLGFKNDTIPILSDVENNWYSKHLSAAHEPSLYQLAQRHDVAVVEALRFLLLRTFDAPVMVRIERRSGQAPRLFAVQLAGKGGYDPGIIDKELNRPLSSKEDQELRTIIARTQIFTTQPKDCLPGTDGAQWVLEAVDASGYHFTDHWSPKRGNVREVGLFLLGLTGWQFKNIY